MGFDRIAILGGRGMLGSDLALTGQQKGLGVRVFDLPEFDITNESLIKEVLLESDVVLNCAAYTNVEKAESQVELANRINGIAVGQLGILAKEANVPVVHISTDFVFDGIQESAYVETDEPNPVSAYGSSKLLGEEELVESGCRYCIVRVEWTYGRHGTHFIKKITEAAKTRDALTVVDDQVGSPTHTVDVALALYDMLELDSFPTGIYHLAASGYVSRYEMTRYLFEQLSITTELHPCKSSDFKTAAQRPLNSRFDCSKLHSLLGREMASWQDMLKDYLEIQ